MNTAEKDVVEETKNIKLTSTRGKVIPVDPIFWYKYNDDYEDLRRFCKQASLCKVADLPRNT